MDFMREEYATILDRRDNPSENSYTRYLFDQGIDKILKKIGEESAETIIAAKNGDNEETVGEICDLLYHLLTLMALQGITPDDIDEKLQSRREKSGNLKTFKTVDKNT
ncbi:MAG: phosphoribosyl-ATP diphosphatase [Clostridia bacterium]|nr:phosphoribosyl-ATP diphosphatase [Clostridia bacterium]